MIAGAGADTTGLAGEVPALTTGATADVNHGAGGRDPAGDAPVGEVDRSPFVDVAVLLPAPGTYTYERPPHLAHARPGCRVMVPFGARNVTGVVVAEHARAGTGVAKPLREVFDEPPAMTRELLGLCGWIADYYEAPIGEVVRAALPAGTQVASVPRVRLTAIGRARLADGALPRGRRDLLFAIGDGLLRRDVPTRLRDELARALTEGWIEPCDDEGKARVRTKRARRASLAVAEPVPDAAGDSAHAAAHDALTTRQAQAVGRSAPRAAVVEALRAGAMWVSELTSIIPTAATHLRALAAAGVVVLEEVEVEVARAVIGAGLPAAVLPPTLSPEQRVATAAIATAPAGHFAAYLLHGVTGSGKTEVYLHVIGEALANGGTAIVLVPEISLTPQLAARFAARFGEAVAVLHSGMSERQRFVEWTRLRDGRARIALGARSAVFAPMRDLAVIVVDEEHDGSFKQEEGVRYHARDVALVRAQRAGAVCILGSATPSLESYASAQAGRMTLLTMTQRPTASPLPTVEVIDLRRYRADGESMLSSPLAQAIEATLAAGDQVILFLNRRGFATFVVCVSCGHAFRCAHCSVSLTYHQFADRMLCHYCGHGERVPTRCPGCAADGTIARKGLGTERIAEAVAARFPQARVARLDRDVGAGAKSEAILTQVAKRAIDILVGTQMVTKGHDFPGVTLVGVLCADTGLSLPDMRAAERTYQLLAQVAGRAGRGERPGKVLVQTYRPEASCVTAAAAHDYQAFFTAEVEARRELGYPPHGRLIALRLDGPDPVTLDDAATRVANLAHAAGRDRAIEVLGPAPAPLARLRGRSRMQIWLRGPDRAALRAVVRALRGYELPPGIRLAVDVDPMSAL